jgi:hypothetical protein
MSRLDRDPRVQWFVLVVIVSAVAGFLYLIAMWAGVVP